MLDGLILTMASTKIMSLGTNQILCVCMKVWYLTVVLIQYKSLFSAYFLRHGNIYWTSRKWHLCSTVSEYSQLVFACVTDIFDSFSSEVRHFWWEISLTCLPVAWLRHVFFLLNINFFSAFSCLNIKFLNLEYFEMIKLFMIILHDVIFTTNVLIWNFQVVETPETSLCCEFPRDEANQAIIPEHAKNSTRCSQRSCSLLLQFGHICPNGLQALWW